MNFAITNAIKYDIFNIIFTSDEEEEINIPRKKRKSWVRPYYLERESTGGFNCVFKQLQDDPQLFYSYTRMNLAKFEELLSMVGPIIKKQTLLRDPLSPSLRLAVTLRYLATGESQTSLAMAYKCSQPSIHGILCETTKALTTVLKENVFPDMTESYFKKVAKGFHERWNFPNCIGAIDGKHVTIQAPSNSGSEFFNYKKTCSMVLMAISDDDYNFIWCDIGAAGRQSDGGIFRESRFGKRFYDMALTIPEPSNVTANFQSVPFVFVADDAFALHQNMLKPYKAMPTTKHKVFNYRLSRARRIIENCFGILSSKWRVFRSPIIANVSLVEDIVKCCVWLHNWLRQTTANYVTPDLIAQDVRGVVVPDSRPNQDTNLLPLQPMHRNTTTLAKNTRDKFAEYFIGEGQVEWQLSKI